MTRLRLEDQNQEIIAQQEVVKAEVQLLEEELEVLRQKMTRIVKYSKYSKLINTENFNL